MLDPAGLLSRKYATPLGWGAARVGAATARSGRLRISEEVEVKRILNCRCACLSQLPKREM
jgi:hypothetical protein